MLSTNLEEVWVPIRVCLWGSPLSRVWYSSSECWVFQSASSGRLWRVVETAFFVNLLVLKAYWWGSKLAGMVPLIWWRISFSKHLIRMWARATGWSLFKTRHSRLFRNRDDSGCLEAEMLEFQQRFFFCCCCCCCFCSFCETPCFTESFWMIVKTRCEMCLFHSVGTSTRTSVTPQASRHLTISERRQLPPQNSECTEFLSEIHN